MKKLLGNTISILFQLACLVLSVFWYKQDKEWEPLIVMIGFIGSLITSIFFKITEKDSKKENITAKKENTTTISGDGNTVIQDASNNQININTVSTEKKVEKNLRTEKGSVTNAFLGREKELSVIRERLTQGKNTLMLVNGEGGIGKTTLATKYYETFETVYKHTVWLYCDSGINTALKSLAPELAIILDQKTEEAQLQTLKTALQNLPKDCLMVLDNANEERYINEFIQHFDGLHWHILITSRCQNLLQEEQELVIEHLPTSLAKKLFKKYYKSHLQDPTPDFNGVLEQLLQALGYNTLCIELFSKNLEEAAVLGENLEKLLLHLELQGLFLKEKSFEIRTKHQKDQPATTDDILGRLYNLAQLKEEEENILCKLAFLPAVSHSLPILLELFKQDGQKLNPYAFKKK